jgi:alanyl aminopeptidase
MRPSSVLVPPLVAGAVAAGVVACTPSAPPLPVPPVALPVPQPQIPLPAEAPPLSRLPADVKPLVYSIALRVDPAQARFVGTADIGVELAQVRDVIWLHGRDLAVHRVTVQFENQAPADARWEQVSPNGVAAIHTPQPVGPGRVVLHVEYDAPFGKSDQGLSVVTRAGDAYAFSQFEATDARRAFPCFDEPGFKTPFNVTLFVPKGQAAISNARETARAPAGEGGAGAWDRVTFAPTPALPTYLVAFAVGPLEVVSAPDLPPSPVRARPLPLRGITTRGRGRELAYTLSHTPEIVRALEGYFGSEYPYDKLDLLAVPEKNGAMENAGALMFAESVLLLDDKPSSIEARFNFAAFVGHEIAHQWFGDLVTMAWWDDLWLNEGFATWMEPRIGRAVRPELHPEVRALEAVHRAMDADSLISARKIRQEITDDNDIDSAFDAITYDKGGAVLGMFERWLGQDVFQKGVRAHLAAHRFGSATASDLIGALSTAAGRDLGAPLRTFLDQPGLPLVEATLACDGKPRLLLKQSRFLPLGSTGTRDGMLWQIPVCARYDDGTTKEACTLLAAPEGTLPLDTTSCPTWVMPNADAAGYYRWSLAAGDRKNLAAALPKLRERERVSYGRSLSASFARGGTPLRELLDGLAPLSDDPSLPVVAPLMDLVRALAAWLDGDATHAGLERYATGLFTKAFREVGWEAKKGEVEEAPRVALRQGVIEFLALTARDPAVRKEAAARGRAYLGLGPRGTKVRDAAMTPELVGVALRVAAEEGGAPVVDALVGELATESGERERRRLLAAIGSAYASPAVAARARELELDPRLHPNEVGIILAAQTTHAATRDEAFRFFAANVDKIVARLPPAFAAGIIGLGDGFCDKGHADELEKLFATRAGTIEGGPRALAGALEGMRLCIARRAVLEPEAWAFFSKAKPGLSKAGPAGAKERR